MENEYQYIDPDSIYTDPKTGVLRNLVGITDRDALTFVETAATTKRAFELKTMPPSVTDSSALFAIHHHLFQDVNAWAGQKRLVEISKGGKQFSPYRVLRAHSASSIICWRNSRKLITETSGVYPTSLLKFWMPQTTCIRFARGTDEHNVSFCAFWLGKRAGR